MTFAGAGPKRFSKDLWHEFGDDDLTGLAAELTYRAFLALFPFLMFLTALGGLAADVADVRNPAERVIDLLGDNLPADAESIVRDQVTGVVEERDLSVLSFAAVGTLWAAAGGAGVLLKALNRVYDIPDRRPLWKKTGLALALTGAAAIALVAGVALVVASQAFGESIAERIGMGAAFGWLVRLVAWPLLLVVIMTGAAFAYWLAPDVELPFKWVSPGAALFGVMGVLTSLLLGVYVANFGSYNETYGSLGGVVVLLLWFYVTGIVFLLGAEVNALIDEHTHGPVLAERRQAAIDAVREKAAEQPENPDALMPPNEDEGQSQPDLPSNGERAVAGETASRAPAYRVPAWFGLAALVLIAICFIPRRAH